MKKYIGLFSLLLLAALGLFLFRRTAEPTQPAPATPPPKPVRFAIVAPGRVEPVSEEVAIGTEIDGRLTAVLVEEGQPVRRGQILATLANADFSARVQLAAAALAERRAELDRLRNGARPQERNESAAFAGEARAVLEQSRAERDRRRFLLDRGAISRSEFEVAERDFAVAQARLEATTQRANLISAPTREEEIRRAEAELAAAEARFAEARAQLARTVILSPLNGFVLRKRKRTGESVSTQMSSPILVLGDTSRLRVRVDVDETDVARVAVGQKVTLRATAYGDKAFTGVVSSVGRILGRKNIRTDEPSERVDTKILETLIDLAPGTELPIGLRVDATIGG